MLSASVPEAGAPDLAILHAFFERPGLIARA